MSHVQFKDKENITIFVFIVLSCGQVELFTCIFKSLDRMKYSPAFIYLPQGFVLVHTWIFEGLKCPWTG